MSGGDGPLPVFVFVMNLLGCLLLSLLVISVALSQRLHKRDVVVNSFLYSWILYSALTSFDQLAMLAHKDLGGSPDSIENTSAVRELVLNMITMVSTLNLSIHLFFIMRSAFHTSSPRSRKIRSCLLVVTPYLTGMLVIPTLFWPKSGSSFSGAISVLISLITPILNAGLLIYYWRWYRKTLKAKMGVMSVSFFLRLLAFSIYQLIYTILLGLGAVTEKVLWSAAFKAVQNLFPILAFCVIGLHLDILNLWFPCIFPRPRSSYEALNHTQGQSSESQIWNSPPLKELKLAVPRDYPQSSLPNDRGLLLSKAELGTY